MSKLRAPFDRRKLERREQCAPSEYANPQEFFSRTYLTEGLSALLIGAAKRFSGSGGDPVIELQTNFGGGKTHSMLALYHMAGNVHAKDLPGLDQLLEKSGLSVPPKIKRAVLVGTSRGPQDTLHVDGGRQIHTTWGELAWQLGGASAFDLIAHNDAKGIAPGSNLLEKIFKAHGPCLILIDEWVAYLRQIYRVEGLPSGSFDANLSFVQSLTEAVKASPGTLLVASLPASQIEVGGEGGQEALARLKQTFSRVESSWRPASQEESYEIVRRRLFKEIPGDRFHHKDNTLKQFAKLYRENSNDFPQGCADEDYRRKLEKAYPIHPELFDQLYVSWGSVEKFQRTRGVLRLMAQVIHELWMKLLIKERLDLEPRLRDLDEKLERVELDLRAFLAATLGEDVSTLPSHVMQRADERIQRQLRQNPALDADYYRTMKGKLEFCDLRELQDIITSKATWVSFDHVFRNKEGLNTKFTQLAELRNGIRHSRTVDEVTRMEGEAAIQWFVQILARGNQRQPAA